MKKETNETHKTIRSNYVDFHCHPAIKPFGKSFNKSALGINNKNKKRRSSIWNYNPPNLKDKILNYISGLTRIIH